MTKKNGNKIYSDWDEIPLLMTLEDISMVVQCSTESIRRYLASGELKGTKAFGQWRVDKDELRRFIDSK